jgi:diaminobutyrate-2-oxoglutarate transaminase/L-2,4-diaminobutyrate decarboxylase
MVDGLMALTQSVADLIDTRKELVLLNRPSISTVLFRLAPTSWQSDEFHQCLRRHLLQSGQAVIAETRINGDVCLKLTLLNPCTQVADIDDLLDIIIAAAKELSAS